MQLALAVYLWAGVWIAWLGGSPAKRAAAPEWASILVFVTLVLLWGVLFPLHVLKVDKASKEDRKALDSAMRKVRNAFQEAEDRKNGKA